MCTFVSESSLGYVHRKSIGFLGDISQAVTSVGIHLVLHIHIHVHVRSSRKPSSERRPSSKACPIELTSHPPHNTPQVREAVLYHSRFP